MTVFVAGGAGFLGSHVCEYYRGLGEDVICYDNFTWRELDRTPYGARKPRQYMIKFLHSLGVEVINGDILNPTLLYDCVKGSDFIVNCAAQPAMTVSIEEPILDHHVNVGGLINLLEAARKYDLPLLHCSTIHVYGNHNKFVRNHNPVNEDMSILQGEVTPLHASKMSGEYYCRAYLDTYGVKSAVFRLSGMYGPRQFGGVDHGWVANFCIRHIMNQPITVFGTVEQHRDILYASDAVGAIDAFRQRLIPEVFNIGGSSVVSFQNVFDVIYDYTGRKVEYTLMPERKGDMHWFACDCSLANRHLDWQPVIGYYAGVSWLCDWVSENKGLFTGGT